MVHSGKTITFATDLLPNEDGIYNLGNNDAKWKIYGVWNGANIGNITNDGKIGTTTNYAVYTTTGGTLTAGSLAVTAPSVSGTATAFISSVSQDSKGQISATKANLPTASTSVTGIIKIGDTANDAMAGNTVVNKVKSTAVTNTSNVEYKILGCAGGATLTSGTDYEAVYNTGITFNPSTGTVTATKFAGALTGNANTATSANITSTKNGVAYYSDTAGKFASTAAGSDGYIFIGKGANTAPTWQEILPIGHGGTGKKQWTQWGLVYADTTTSLAQVTAGAAGNATFPLISSGAGAPNWYNGLSLVGTTSSDWSASFNGSVYVDKTITIASKVTLQWNTADQSLDFVFA